MIAPLFKFGLFGQEIGLLFAFLIGIAFGFFLEKGGLGNAKKLVGQFYLTDFAVFKVMFSAIITAMLGLFFFSWFGLLDLSLVAYTPTYTIPYLVAGLIFGAGFVIGGLCPGTACVSTATGNIDGMVLLGGVFCGIMLFGETFKNFNEFLYSYPQYEISIPEYLSVSHGLVVLITVMFAVTGFIVAGKVERKVAIKAGNVNIDSSSRNSKTNISLGLVAIVLSIIVLIGNNPYQQNKYNEIDGIPMVDVVKKSLNAEELANLIISRKSDIVIVDLRSPDKYQAYHIPSAISNNIDFKFSETINTEGKIIVYGQGNTIPKNEAGKLKSIVNNHYYFLKGGLNSWFDEIIFPDLRIPKGFNPEKIKSIERRSRFFGGNPKVKKAKESSTAKFGREGC